MPPKTKTECGAPEGERGQRLASGKLGHQALRMGGEDVEVEACEDGVLGGVRQEDGQGLRRALLRHAEPILAVSPVS